MTLRLPLFDDDADAAAIVPKTTKDDVEFAKQRRRNRKKPGRTPPAPAEGPCCERCVNWMRPQHDDDEFGECCVLYVATERNPAYRVEKGEVHNRDWLRSAHVPGEPLRCGPSFRCNAFQQIEEKAA